MADGGASYENNFSEWLAKQVSPAQLSTIYSTYTDINSFCLSRKILKKPLFETDNLATLSHVRETVECNKTFAFCFKKQKRAMLAAIQYYYRFIKEAKDNCGMTDSKYVSNNKSKRAEQAATESSSLIDFLVANNISVIDNRQKNGCLWMIGGEELKPIADKCSALGVTFHFRADGSRALDYSPAWWTTDDFNGSMKKTDIVPTAGNALEDKPSMKTEIESVVKTISPTISEIETLLSEEVFSPLKLALAEENIRTIEELKALKLWAFMNQHNLYSISLRQAVLTKVRQLLEPTTAVNPELLYELRCGSNIYFGDTLSKTFLHFCEDIAKKYPLFFRSILDKTIGSVSDFKIYRSPENGDFIRMENPTCYISANLAKDSVITAVKWIAQQCMSTELPISIKEPGTSLQQSSPAETSQEELSDTTLGEQNETATSVPALIQDESESSESSANDSNEQILNLAKRCSLAFTKPTGFYYKGMAFSCTSWSELYVMLVRELYSDYQLLFQHDMCFEGSSRIDIGSKATMTSPREIRNNVYLECNVSATGIARKIRWLLGYCSVSIDDVIITYRQRNSGNYQQTNQLINSGDSASSVCPDSSQENESVDSEQISNAEKIVLDADMNGVTYDSLHNTLMLTMVATKSIVQESKRIVEIKGKLYHEDAFVDWDDGANQMCLIMEKLMQKNNGYVSATQLYDYARVEMNMFLNDNDMNDERSVYEIAQHLFEKNNFKGNHYSFSGKAHISKSEDVVNNNFDIVCKFAEEHGGIFQEDDLVEYLTSIGIKTVNLKSQVMHIGKEPDFFLCEPDIIISAKSMGIDDSWKESVKRALRNLLNDADGHIILRQIQPIWYESLPTLPEHSQWTPLLLQYILHFYSEELGAKTIMAMQSQSMDTLHAMLVKMDSPIQNFGDAVITFLIESGIEQRSFGAEELRQLLVKPGMIQGNELIWNMPKALAKDERFAWDAKGENVTVRV